MNPIFIRVWRMRGIFPQGFFIIRGRECKIMITSYAGPSRSISSYSSFFM
jgi:hypothetical protein